MNLVAKCRTGHLDPMSACMLLWAGAVSFPDDALRWDETSHRVGQPKIHDDVISLYAVPHNAVEEALPDLTDLMEELGRDERLSVSADLVAEPVRELLAAGQLTGASLFALQSGTHPLIIEALDATTVQVRYATLLSRGIPHLQDLLCRMVCHLRATRGDEGAFTVRFVESNAAAHQGGGESHACVEGGVRRLDESVEVSRESFDEVRRFTEAAQLQALQSLQAPDDDGEQDADLKFLRLMAVLESNAYATTTLHTDMRQHLETLRQGRKELEESKPNTNDSRFRKAKTPAGLTTGPRAARSLAIRSAIWIVIGIAIMFVGSRCVTDNERLAVQVIRIADDSMGIVMDAVNLALGQTGQLGVRGMLQLPTEPVANFLRIFGLIVMTIGIVLPVRKILKHRRRLSRELKYTRTQTEYMNALIEKQRFDSESAYTLALEAWTTGIEKVGIAIETASDSCNALAESEEQLKTCIGDWYQRENVPSELANLAAVCTMVDYLNAGKATEMAGEQGAAKLYQQDLRSSRVGTEPKQATRDQPTLREAQRSADLLVRRTFAAPSEEERHEIIAEHCRNVSTLIARTQL